MKPSGIKAAAKAYVEATKNNVVSLEQLEKRARVCRMCKFKQKTRGTSRVSQVLGFLSQKNMVPDDISKYSCGICKCSLLLLLPAKTENLHKDSPEEAERRPGFCWMVVEERRAQENPT